MRDGKESGMGSVGDERLARMVAIYDGEREALIDALVREAYRAPDTQPELGRTLRNEAVLGSVKDLGAPSSTPLGAPEGVALPAPALKPIEPARLAAALRALDTELFAVKRDGAARLCHAAPLAANALAAVLPSTGIEELGSRRFCETHGLRYAYVAGAMAGGIASAELVIAMARAGFLSFFGAGGLAFPRIEEAIARIKSELMERDPYGFNLLHNPFEPAEELRVAQLYLKHGVRRVDASAFMQLTPALLLYRAKGLRQLPDGTIQSNNHLFAKVSRPEVAAQFMAPAPEALIAEVRAAELITEEEARLLALVPVAEAITVEADSGGHTDQRPLTVLLPMVLRMRDEAVERHGYGARGAALHIGAGGGIGEPSAAHAAFSMGADYLMTGSINQASLQAGTSKAVKRMLLEADMADVAMAPAPDMFELGARVQVLKRGTFYPQRAQKLYDLYRSNPAWEAIPAAEREKVERQVFQRTFESIWSETERYWDLRDSKKAEEARRNPKARMALCFRWYLGMSSRWATVGEPSRQLDYQIWCGASMGALNRWTKGTWLGTPEGRDVVLLARAILYGAAVLGRRELAARAGVPNLPSVMDLAAPPERALLDGSPRQERREVW